MTLLKEPIASSGDNLDHLLRAFFQAEMPDPWPGMEVPSRPVVVVAADAPEETPSRSSGSLCRSRLALAASIALLVSGPLFLAGALRETTPSSPISSSVGDSAHRESLHAPRYRSSESLLVTPDGVIIRVDISEMSVTK
jgi:hypothetical protein